jgi:hypothetical protein
MTQCRRLSAGAVGRPTTRTALPPDRLRQYQEQLADQEARLRQELAEAQSAAAAAPQTSATPRESATPADPITEEKRRREYASLFSETVAFTRRAAGSATPPANVLGPRADADTALTDALARTGIAGSPPPASAASTVALTPPPAVAPAAAPPAPTPAAPASAPALAPAPAVELAIPRVSAKNGQHAKPRIGPVWDKTGTRPNSVCVNACGSER